MPDHPNADESRERLEGLGWCVRVEHDRWPGKGSAWVVYASRDTAVFSAVGATEAEAMARACRQAEAVLERRPGKGEGPAAQAAPSAT